MRVWVLAVSVSMLALMIGCRSMTAETTFKAVASDASCPAEFQDEVKIVASAVPLKIPADLAKEDGLNSVLGRRILLSVSPTGEAHGLRIVSSELAVTPLGGTFRGW